MSKKAIATGVVHTVPTDLRKALTSNPPMRAAWQGITPLARNEWICWITSVKKPETRKHHIERATAELAKESAGLVVGQAALTDDQRFEFGLPLLQDSNLTRFRSPSQTVILLA